MVTVARQPDPEHLVEERTTLSVSSSTKRMSSTTQAIRSGLMHAAVAQTNNQATHYSQWLSLQNAPETSTFAFFFGSHTSENILPSLRSYLIHPMSPCMVCINTVSALLNVYCFIEMPVLIAFFWNVDACFRSKTLEVDMAVEVFFLLEVLLGFFVGHYTQKGRYVSTHAEVGRHYITSGSLLFDLFTAAPITWIEYIIIFSGSLCTVGENDGSSSLAYAKPIRLLRPMRLIKVAKLFRILKVMQTMESLVSLDLWVQRTLVLGIQFVSIVHIFNCSFWLIKSIVTSEAEMLEFLLINGIDPDSNSVTWECYVLSGYFINTVFTTVGFGDVSGSNAPERGFIIVAMWVGTIVFSYVVSEVEAFVSFRMSASNERKHRVADVKRLLRKEHCPGDLETEILEWIDACHVLSHERQEQLQLVRQLPADLQERLMICLTKPLFGFLPIATRVPGEEQRDPFVSALARGAKFTIVRKGSLIATVQELLLGRIFVIVSGRVRACREGHCGQALHLLDKSCLLVRGDFFGVLDSVDQPTTALARRDSEVFIADRTCELAMVTREQVEDIMPTLSEDIQECVACAPEFVPLYSHDGQVTEDCCVATRAAQRPHAKEERSGMMPPSDTQQHADVVAVNKPEHSEQVSAGLVFWAPGGGHTRMAGAGSEGMEAEIDSPLQNGGPDERSARLDGGQRATPHRDFHVIGSFEDADGGGSTEASTFRRHNTFSGSDSSTNFAGRPGGIGKLRRRQTSSTKRILRPPSLKSPEVAAHLPLEGALTPPSERMSINPAYHDDRGDAPGHAALVPEGLHGWRQSGANAVAVGRTPTPPASGGEQVYHPFLSQPLQHGPLGELEKTAHGSEDYLEAAQVHRHSGHRGYGGRNGGGTDDGQEGALLAELTALLSKMMKEQQETLRSDMQRIEFSINDLRREVSRLSAGSIQGAT